MLNTKQVRAIMKQHGNMACDIYTNKYQSSDINIRHVKCYYYDDSVNAKLVAELRAKAGRDNVRITKGTKWGGPGLIVKCKLA